MPRTFQQVIEHTETSITQMQTHPLTPDEFNSRMITSLAKSVVHLERLVEDYQESLQRAELTLKNQEHA